MENILVLEISEDKIKILEIRSTEKGWQPLHCAKLDLPAGSTKDGVITDPKSIADKLISFAKEKKIAAKKAIAVLSGPYIFTKIIRLPHNFSDEQIRINLEAEVNQYQIFSGKESVIGFKKIEEINEEGIKKVNILFVSVFKAITESYLKALELAGFDLIGLDVPIFSVLRLLENVDFKSSSLDVTLLVLIGKKTLDACIIKGNRPRFLHSVDVDISDFEKEREGFIDRLVSAIKLVVNFYQVRFIQGEEINQIIINPLVGGMDNIQALLQKKIPQIPVQISNPLNKICIGKEKIADLEELRFSFPGLLGAALRLENKNQPYNINLLFEQKAQRQSRLNQIQLLFISLSVVLAVIVILFIGFNLKIKKLEKKISALSDKYNQPSLDLKWALSVKEKRDILARQSSEASEIIDGIKKPAYFSPIAKAMILTPPGLFLTELSLEQENRQLFLTGQSVSEKPVFDYISGLSGCGYFSSVEIASSKNELERVKFVIKCIIK